MLSIVPFVLGLVETNTYLIADPETREAVVIDPAGDGARIVAEAARREWRIGSIWLTHAHFDHLAGAGEVADRVDPPPPVALHPDDYTLWRMQGGAALFGMRIDPGPEPTIDFRHGQVLHLGGNRLEVRHAPGHFARHHFGPPRSGVHMAMAAGLVALAAHIQLQRLQPAAASAIMSRRG